jgi:hypothetical protein
MLLRVGNLLLCDIMLGTRKRVSLDDHATKTATLINPTEQCQPVSGVSSNHRKLALVGSPVLDWWIVEWHVSYLSDSSAFNSKVQGDMATGRVTPVIVKHATIALTTLGSRQKSRGQIALEFSTPQPRHTV